MDKKRILKSYFNNLKQLINFEDDTISKIIQTCDLLLESKKNGKKNLIFWERRKWLAIAALPPFPKKLNFSSHFFYFLIIDHMFE